MELFAILISSEEVLQLHMDAKLMVYVLQTLSYQGTLIENIQVEFKDGKIIEARSSKGEDVLLKVLDSEGSRRLGEVALVPNSFQYHNWE